MKIFAWKGRCLKESLKEKNRIFLGFISLIGGQFILGIEAKIGKEFGQPHSYIKHHIVVVEDTCYSHSFKKLPKANSNSEQEMLSRIQVVQLKNMFMKMKMLKFFSWLELSIILYF